MALTTVTYIKNANRILMLHRVKEEDDFNEGKWLGVGGHLEKNESPNEAALREIKEESGLNVDDMFFQGIVTFVHPSNETDYIYVFRANSSSDKFHPTSEGVLKWIDTEKVLELNLWEGDLLFLPYILDESEKVFSLKVEYNEADELVKYEFY